MEMSQKKLLNLFFKIAITVGLAGIFLYLFQELISAFEAKAYTVFIVMANIIGMVAIVVFIVRLFLSEHDMFLMNLGIILGAVHVFLYIFAHFFAPGYIDNKFEFKGFADNDINFIGLLLLTLLSIGVIVIFALRFTKRDQFGIFEKFSVLLWVVALGIFTFSNEFYFRVKDAFAEKLKPVLGITFLPTNFELIFILFIAIFLILSFFVGVNQKILDLLKLLILNSLFLTAAIATTNAIGFSLPSGVFIISIFGNIFVIIGTIMLVVCTVLVLQEKYPKSLASRSKN